jgi:hypothetical protein
MKVFYESLSNYQDPLPHFEIMGSLQEIPRGQPLIQGVLGNPEVLGGVFDAEGVGGQWSILTIPNA